MSVDAIERHKVSWRFLSRSRNTKHAVILTERNRLAFHTVCGRSSANSRPAGEGRECTRCAAALKPLPETFSLEAGRVYQVRFGGAA